MRRATLFLVFAFALFGSGCGGDSPTDQEIREAILQKAEGLLWCGSDIPDSSLHVTGLRKGNSEIYPDADLVYYGDLSWMCLEEHTQRYLFEFRIEGGKPVLVSTSRR